MDSLYRVRSVGLLSAILVTCLLILNQEALGFHANDGQGVAVVVLDSADLTEREEAILSVLSD